MTDNNNINRLINQNLDFVFSILLSFLFVFPFILGNNVYEDDILRNNVASSLSWLSDERPFISLLMILLSGNFNLSNVFPLGLILSVFITSTAGIYVSRLMFPSNNKIFERVFFSLFIIVNPYFCQNLSFQYDSLSMSLAQALSIYAATLNTTKYLDFVYKSLLIFIIFGLYQPCLNTLLAFTLLFFCEKNNNKDLIKNMAINCVIVFIVFIIYHVLFFKIVQYNAYVIQHHKIIPFNMTAFHYIYINILTTIHELFLILFDSSFLFFTVLLCFSMLIHIIDKKDKNYLYFFYPLFILFFSIGFLIILRDPLLLPRIMVSFSVIIAFVLYKIYNKYSFINVPKITIFLTILIFLPLYSFSYSYVNALTQHQENEYYLADNIMDNLESNGYNIDTDYLSILGNAKDVSSVYIAEKNHPIIKQLLRKTLDSNNYYSLFILYRRIDNFRGKHFAQLIKNNNINCKKNKIILHKKEYDITKKENQYCIVFPENNL